MTTVVWSRLDADAAGGCSLELFDHARHLAMISRHGVKPVYEYLNYVALLEKLLR
jgi:hypothetical protein